jgi:arginase
LGDAAVRTRLDSEMVPAVDSPQPDGFTPTQLAEILAPLSADPRCLGMQLTIYDPLLDPDGASGERIVEMVVRALGGASLSS